MRHVHSHSRSSPPETPSTSCDTTSPNCTSTPSSASRSASLASFHPLRCGRSPAHSTLSNISCLTIARTRPCSPRASAAKAGTTQSALASFVAAGRASRESVCSSAARRSWCTRGSTRSIMSVGRGRSQSSCTSTNPIRLQYSKASRTLAAVCPLHFPTSTSTASSMRTATPVHVCSTQASLTAVYPFGMFWPMNGKARAHLTSTSRTATAVLPSPPTLSTQCTLPSASSTETAWAAPSLPASGSAVTTRRRFSICAAMLRSSFKS
ncbi:hypothetical protein T484DRAFT_1980995 [Baffinella frigidus]|nr:hypothetical protein T484DRAFT_1980995 [Cryptophyta sp. CCMP2293]